jgi:hypothetical protein
VSFFLTNAHSPCVSVSRVTTIPSIPLFLSFVWAFRGGTPAQFLTQQGVPTCLDSSKPSCALFGFSSCWPSSLAFRDGCCSRFRSPVRSTLPHLHLEDCLGTGFPGGFVLFTSGQYYRIHVGGDLSSFKQAVANREARNITSHLENIHRWLLRSPPMCFDVLLEPIQGEFPLKIAVERTGRAGDHMAGIGKAD